MQNEEWKNLVNVLRCGIGPSFDINKLYYNRINIMTDADVDGFYISAGILAFFYIHLRPIIEAGKLYKVFSPLYYLDDKEHPYAANKIELIGIYHKKINKHYKINPEKINKYLSKDDMQEFLTDTYYYRENLIRAAGECGNVNKFFIERIIAYMTLSGVVRSETDYDDLKTLFSNQKFIKGIMSFIQNKYKEVKVNNDGVFYGVVEGKYVSVKVGKRFFKKVSSLIDVYNKYGYELSVKEKDKDPVKMSIAEFLDNCTKLMPKIKLRYKGLGEIKGEQLHQTAMDISHRVSVQYTIDDVEKELKAFEITHGKGEANATRRKEMMKSYKINREDLDN